jgi:hypothetical protein
MTMTVSTPSTVIVSRCAMTLLSVANETGASTMTVSGGWSAAGSSPMSDWPGSSWRGLNGSMNQSPSASRFASAL